MSKQYNKILKRRRRKAYIKRKKKLAKLMAKQKGAEQNVSAPAPAEKPSAENTSSTEAPAQ